MRCTPAPRARSGRARHATHRPTRSTAAWTALIALFAALACLAAAAPRVGAAPVSGDELWRKVYDDTGGWTDIAMALVLAPGGKGVYVTGSILPNGAKSDLALIKYKPSGGRAWLRTFDGAAHGNDEGLALACDRARNVYVGGYVDKSLGQDFLLVKYDTGGHRKWLRTYDGAAHGDDNILALAVDARGNVYAAGRSEGAGTNWDAALVKWTPTGRRAWVRRYNGAADFADEFGALVIDTARGRVYAAGVAAVDAQTKTWLLIRYSVAGTRVWTQTFGAPNTTSDSGSVALTPGGAVLQAGSGGQTAIHAADALLGKWTAAGAIVWSDGYSAASTDYFADLAVDRHGTIFTVGHTKTGLNNYDALVCRFTPAGTLDDFVTIGGDTYDDYFNAVACDGAGNVYATGTVGTALYDDDWVTVKFSNDLDALWQPCAREHDVDLSDRPWAIAVRGAGSANPGVYVTGKGSQSSFAWDWMTIKYKP